MVRREARPYPAGLRAAAEVLYPPRPVSPAAAASFPDEAVAYVARQVKVPASDLGLYEWSGRTFEYHRAQIRTFLGFPGMHGRRRREAHRLAG